MRIGIAQVNTTAGDYEATARRMGAMARTAHDQGVELLLFPLCTLTGPQPVDYASQEGSLLDLTNALVALSDSVACACIVPVVTDMEGTPFAEAMLLHDGEVVPLRLMGLTAGASAQVPGMPPVAGVVPGDVSAFEFGGLRLGVAFTYDDLEALERSEDQLDAVLFFSSYGYALDDPGSAMGASLAENRYRSDAGSLDAWLVGVASVGGYGTQVFAGSSFVLDHNAELVVSAPAFEEALVACDLDVVPSDVPSLEPEIYNRSLHLWESLSLGLHDYLSKQGHTDVALVLDGSLASSLLAILASDSLGPRHVHALVAPGRWEGADPHALAASLHVDVREAPVRPDLPGEDARLFCDLCQAHLAAFARQCGALPVSAEDKTGLALEATVASCRVGTLLPFGDVYRTDLIELAHMRNTISPLVPASAFGAYDVPDVEGLNAAGPTPHMRLQRADVILATHVEWERGLTDVCARQGDERLVAAVLERLRQCEEARAAMRSVLVMSSRTLHDARMPLGFAWRDRVRSDDERARGAQAMERISAVLGSHEDPKGPGAAPEGTLEGLEARFIAQTSLPEGVDRQALQGSLGELLGLVQDLLQGGGLSADRPDGSNPPIDGPFGPLTWGSPFSEN